MIVNIISIVKIIAFY